MYVRKAVRPAARACGLCSRCAFQRLPNEATTSSLALSLSLSSVCCARMAASSASHSRDSTHASPAAYVCTCNMHTCTRDVQSMHTCYPHFSSLHLCTSVNPQSAQINNTRTVDTEIKANLIPPHSFLHILNINSVEMYFSSRPISREFHSPRILFRFRFCNPELIRKLYCFVSLEFLRLDGFSPSPCSISLLCRTGSQLSLPEGARAHGRGHTCRHTFTNVHTNCLLLSWRRASRLASSASWASLRLWSSSCC